MYFSISFLNKMAETQKLRKELSLVQLTIIGLVGAVGTGVLFASTGMAALAGPAIIIAWILGAVFYLFIGLTYYELSTTYPEAGGPTRYSLYTHGRFTNIINAFGDLIWYLFIPPIEALATVEALSFFFPILINSSDVPTIFGAGLGVVLMLLFIPFNYFGVKPFGKATKYFGIIKLIFYALVVIGIASIFFRPGNFTNYSGFAPFGFAGIFAAVPLAMFAFGGIRVVPDYAEETSKKHNINNNIVKKSLLYTIFGQSILYIAFAVVFIGGISWAHLGIATGNWAGLSSVPGNPFVDIAGYLHSHIILALVLLVAIVGPFVTGYVYVGGGSRILFAMGRSKIVSSKVKQLSKDYAVPYIALIIFAIIGAIVAYISAPLPTIYGLLTDAVVAGYIGFAVNPVAMIVSRRQGITKKTNMLPGGTAIAALAFISASLIVFWSGWITVSYSVLLITIGVVVFSIISKIKQHVFNSFWYIFYILFLLLMTYINYIYSKSFIGNFYLDSLIVAVVAIALFFPWGIYSGLKKQFLLK